MKTQEKWIYTGVSAQFSQLISWAYQSQHLSQ